MDENVKPSVLIAQLQEVRRELKLLEEEEALLLTSIIKAAGHSKLGQSTYDLDGYKVTIKTSENVRLDKNLLNVKWHEGLPINRSYSYTLRQKDFDALMKSGTPEQKMEIAEFVTTSPAKPQIKIGE